MYTILCISRAFQVSRQHHRWDQCKRALIQLDDHAIPVGHLVEMKAVKRCT